MDHSTSESLTNFPTLRKLINAIGPHKEECCQSDWSVLCSIGVPVSCHEDLDAGVMHGVGPAVGGRTVEQVEPPCQ